MTPAKFQFALPADGWAAGLCPVCLLLARTAPASANSLAIACESCGDFDLSDAAEDVFDTRAGRLDRERLSGVVADVCMMAECGRPLIDALTASTLIALAGL